MVKKMNRNALMSVRDFEAIIRKHGGVMISKKEASKYKRMKTKKK